jgi:hypothetical protein
MTFFFCCQNIKNAAVLQLDVASPKQKKKGGMRWGEDEK